MEPGLRSGADEAKLRFTLTMNKRELPEEPHAQIEWMMERYGHWVDPKSFERRDEIEAEVARFCEAKLNDEWRQICVDFLDAIEAEEPHAFRQGDLKIYAAGVIHALGQLNFLFDASTKPHVSVGDIADFYGVKKGSMTQRGTMLRDLMGLHPLNGQFLTSDNSERTGDLQEMMAQTIAAMAPGATVESVLAEMPHFGARKSSRDEFIDRDRRAMSDYYELQERAMSGRGLTQKATEKGLRDLIARDPDFLDPYLALGEILDDGRRSDEAQQLLDEAYQRALNLITDKKGEWPRRIEWGWMENRHILRTLFNRAFQWWQDGKSDEALPLFRKILRACPGDNLGVRYFILAILEEMSFAQFDRRFDKGGYWDMSIAMWFDQTARKHPDDFEWWFKEMEE